MRKLGYVYESGRKIQVLILASVQVTKMDDEKSAPLKQKLKLYGKSTSPVCRVVMWLLEAGHIPYEEKTINLAKGKRRHCFTIDYTVVPAAGEHLGDTPLAQELVKINPNRQIPSMDDGGFCLFES